MWRQAGVRWPQAKGRVSHQELGGAEGPSPRAPVGARPCPQPDSGLLAPRTVTTHFYLCSCPGSGTVLRRPQDTRAPGDTFLSQERPAQSAHTARQARCPGLGTQPLPPQTAPAGDDAGAEDLHQEGPISD